MRSGPTWPTSNELGGRADVARFALFDVAFPVDSDELTRLHGDALVVLVAVTRDSTELPLRQIYVSSAGATTQLTPVARVLSRVRDTRIAQTFGTFREDVVLLMPVQVRIPGADLTVDFATHRDGFRLAVFSDDVPPVVASYRGMVVPAGAPARTDVESVLKREYSDLAAVTVLEP